MIFSYKRFLKKMQTSNRVNDRETFRIWETNNCSAILRKELFYKNRIEKICPVIKYQIPKQYKQSGEWDLLLRLIAISYCCEYEFVFIDPEFCDSQDERDISLPELIITVNTDDGSVTKSISELNSRVIIRLFEIFCSEQINYQQAMADSVDDFVHNNDLFRKRCEDYKLKYFEATERMKRVKCMN